MIDWEAEGNAACAEWQEATPDKTPEQKAAIIAAINEATRKRWAWIHKIISGDDLWNR